MVIELDRYQSGVPIIINNSMDLNQEIKLVLLESLSQPYKWKIENQPPRNKNYYISFQSLDRTVTVVIEPLESPNRVIWNLAFSIDDYYGLTSEGDEFRIFATVLDIIRWFIREVKPMFFEFSAEKKPTDNATQMNSREKLYHRLAQKYIRELPEYKLDIIQTNWETKYRIRHESAKKYNI